MESTASARRLVSVFLRGGLALALVGTALGLTMLLQSVVSTAGYLFFYTAVVASAWFGGKWPGGLAVISSTLIVEYFFIPPVHSFGVNRDSLPVFIEFAASAVVISWFSAFRKRAETALAKARDELQMRVEERTAELKQTNCQLLAEMAERKRAEDAYYEAQAELVQEGIARDRAAWSEREQMKDLLARYESLTAREKEVLQLVASGLLNKQVGAELGASELTIKTHRGRVMQKMMADSLADLVRMAEKLKPYIAKST